MKSVILVEPDRHFASLVQAALDDVAEVAVARSAQTAIDWLDQPNRQCDLVISELALGSHSGVEIIHELRSHGDWLNLPVLVHSRVARPANLTDRCLQEDYGVIDYIQKGRHSTDVLRDFVLAVSK